MYVLFLYNLNEYFSHLVPISPVSESTLQSSYYDKIGTYLNFCEFYYDSEKYFYLKTESQKAEATV